MEKKKKNNAFRWILHFAGQCRGRLTASVLLAILGSACGVVPYLAVTQIIIRILGKNYDLVPIGLLALLALLGYLGGTWLNTASTMLSHRSAFMILKNIRTDLTAKLSRVPMGTILDTPSAGAHDPRADRQYLNPGADAPVSVCTGLEDCSDFSYHHSHRAVLLYGDDEGL